MEKTENKISSNNQKKLTESNKPSSTSDNTKQDSNNEKNYTYTANQIIGSGSFGVVYMVHINETHEDLAMKVYSKQVLTSKRDTMVMDATTGKLKPKNYLEEI